MDELDFTSDESNSSQCFDIETISGGAEKIAQVRAHALNLRKHVCIPLKAQRKRPKIFDFTDNVVGETTYFPEGTTCPKMTYFWWNTTHYLDNFYYSRCCG